MYYRNSLHRETAIVDSVKNLFCAPRELQNNVYATKWRTHT